MMNTRVGQPMRHIPVLSKPAIKPRFSADPQPPALELDILGEIARKNPVVQRMFDLIDIPSATPQKDPRFAQTIEDNLNKIRDKIAQEVEKIGIGSLERHPNGSLVIRVPGSAGYEDTRPLMLTAHMDIVPGDEQNPNKPIQRRFKTINGKEFITSNGTTTLGSDDKGGIAMILDNLARLKNRPHAPLEIIFSPDEESSCNSLKTLDSSQFKAKQVIVVDEFYDFKVTNGLASAVDISLQVKGTNGGHSGDDINRPNRLNAIMLMNEVTRKLGTGVIANHPNYPGVPLISKNLGIMQGGTAPNGIPESATARYLLRSFDKQAQTKELNRMEKVLQSFERRYQKTQPNLTVRMNWIEEYPAWQGDPNSNLPKICQEAAKAMKINNVGVGPMHAAAQASILANKTNAYGEKFDAVLIGPRIEEAHTVRERIDWKSLVQVNEWLGHIIDTYTQQSQPKTNSN